MDFDIRVGIRHFHSRTGPFVLEFVTFTHELDHSLFAGTDSQCWLSRSFHELPVSLYLNVERTVRIEMKAIYKPELTHSVTYRIEQQQRTKNKEYRPISRWRELTPEQQLCQLRRRPPPRSDCWPHPARRSSSDRGSSSGTITAGASRAFLCDSRKIGSRSFSNPSHRVYRTSSGRALSDSNEPTSHRTTFSFNFLIDVVTIHSEGVAPCSFLFRTSSPPNARTPVEIRP